MAKDVGASRNPGKLSAERKAAVAAHISDRMIAEEQVFEHEGKKDVGLAPGYLARGSDGKLFMIKTAKKEPRIGGSDTNDARTVVNEFVSGPMYKRVLYDRTPIIEGVRSRDHGYIAIRSKFLHNFRTFVEFSGLETVPTYAVRAELQQVQGAEKLFAAMLFCGERDVHGNNFGVMTLEDGSKVYAKIDHGHSCENRADNVLELLNILGKRFSPSGGLQFAAKIDFSLDKFRQAVDEIGKISDEEIEDMIAARIGQLKKMGMDIRTVDPANVQFRRDNGEWGITRAESYGLLEKRYREFFIRQRDQMKGLGAMLEVINRIELRGGKEVTEEWKNNGRWLTDMYGKSDLLWNLKYPTEWAYTNGHTVRLPDPAQLSAEALLTDHSKAQKLLVPRSFTSSFSSPDKAVIGKAPPITQAIVNLITEKKVSNKYKCTVREVNDRLIGYLDEALALHPARHIYDKSDPELKQNFRDDLVKQLAKQPVVYEEYLNAQAVKEAMSKAITISAIRTIAERNRPFIMRYGGSVRSNGRTI